METNQIKVKGRLYHVNDKRIHIPDDVIAGLLLYAEAEKKRQDNPLIAEMITWRSIANHILRNEVQKRGYYQPVR